jgi:hypothetical protein
LPAFAQLIAPTPQFSPSSLLPYRSKAVIRNWFFPDLSLPHVNVFLLLLLSFNCISLRIIFYNAFLTISAGKAASFLFFLAQK